MKERYEQALRLQQELRFCEAETLWEQLMKEDKSYLEKWLQDLIRLQEETCRDAMSQCRLSMTYHYQTTRVLERYGDLLGDRRYYYRTYTYLLAADYLLHIDLCECAIDCYFRALIFQTKYRQEDGGYLKIKTICGILCCYDMVGDREMLTWILKEFEKDIPFMQKTWQKTWKLLLYLLDLAVCQDLTALTEGELREVSSLLKVYHYSEKAEQYLTVVKAEEESRL